MYRTHVIKDFPVKKHKNTVTAEIYQWIKLHAMHTPNNDVLYDSYYITHNQKLMFDMLYPKSDQRAAEYRLRNIGLIDSSGEYTMWYPHPEGVQLEMFSTEEMGSQVVEEEDPPLPITWIP